MSVGTKRMFWRDPGFYFTLLLLSFVVLVIVLSFGFPYRAKLFPLIVGFGSLPLILVDVLGKIFPNIAEKMEVLRGGQVFDTSKLEAGGSIREDSVNEDEAQVDTRSLLKVFLWFSGCFVLFYFFGFLIAVVAFLFFFLKFFSSCRLITAVEITAAIGLTVWVIFTVVLKVPCVW